MKNILQLIILILVIGCSSKKEETETTSEENTTTIVSEFLKDVKTLDSDTIKTPIIAFKELAKSTANKTINLTKDNIQEALLEAKGFKHCVITTGIHTVVKVENIDNCKPSGSWGACMPYGVGYVKKGNLTYNEGLINNIIGRPDGQSRIMFLFN